MTEGKRMNMGKENKLEIKRRDELTHTHTRRPQHTEFLLVSSSHFKSSFAKVTADRLQ